MHRFVSFFFSFLRSFCKGLRNLNCDRHVHMCLGNAYGRKEKHSPFSRSETPQNMGNSCGYTEAG